jgi:hypothetical protein
MMIYLILGFLIWLLIFWVIGLIVNRIAKRPVMNWMAWLGTLYMAGFALSFVGAQSGLVDAYRAGSMIGALFIPVLILLACAYFWRKRNPLPPRDWSK